MAHFKDEGIGRVHFGCEYLVNIKYDLAYALLAYSNLTVTHICAIYVYFLLSFFNILVCVVDINGAPETMTQKLAPPQWPGCYTVTGAIRLPYAEIKETFTAYYETKKNRSRIDYYGRPYNTLVIVT